jgi:peptidoglycan hydrolase CwlO-like protein
MTQAIEISEVLKRLDSIQSDIQDIKLSQARTEEQIKATDQRIGDLGKSPNKRIDSLEPVVTHKKPALGEW